MDGQIDGQIGSHRNECGQTDRQTCLRMDRVNKQSDRKAGKHTYRQTCLGMEGQIER
jgi:hypothetical protein